MKTNNSVKRIVEFQQQIQERKDKITELLENIDVKEGRKTLQTLEEEIQRLHNEISDLQMAIVLQELIGSAESQQSIAKMIKGLQRKFKNYGCRLTPVRMANGTVVELVVSYYARPCNERMVKSVALAFIQHFSSLEYLMVAAQAWHRK